MAITTYLYGIAFAIIFTIVLQHVGRKHEWKITPGSIIDSAATFCEQLWEKIGRFCVWISSFYTRIDLKDWWITIDQILGPSYRFVMSWTKFITTYVYEMKLYDHPYLISCGSATIVGAFSYLLYLKYSWIEPYVTIVYGQTSRLIPFLKRFFN